MKNSFLIVSAFWGIASLSASASLVKVDEWTVSGDSWTHGEQPAYYDGHKTIYSANRDATLVSDKGPRSYTLFNLGSNLLTRYFYGYSDQHNFVLTGSGLEQDVKLFILGITLTRGFEAGHTPVLNLGGVANGLAFTSMDTSLENGEVIGPNTEEGDYESAPTFYVFTWDVSDLDLKDVENYSIDFGIKVHASIRSVIVAQHSVVPEPSAYALVGGAVGLAVVAGVRRRRRS